GGRITAATELDVSFGKYKFFFDRDVYGKRVYDGVMMPQPETELVFGPNIKDWPAMPALPENLLVKIISFIDDPVTTTDELIPSGETSSFRSNPERLAEFTLSRRDPGYVQRAKDLKGMEEMRRGGKAGEEIAAVLKQIQDVPGCAGFGLSAIGIGSAIFARKPGDGSAREQAASCQRVLGASANFAVEYATKRYRSNLINWGILPFTVADEAALNRVFGLGAYVFFPGIRGKLTGKAGTVTGFALGEKPAEIALGLGELTDSERQILLDGCLINHYKR
ncbi:MAG: hydratase, partial [Treponema sp.]|nr:hydratase [Treponema sp.]